MSRKTIGVQRKPSTMIIPAMEKILNKGKTPVRSLTIMFRKPASGPKRRIHPMTFIRPGMANETNAAT
jgi:hypothetical protein